MKSKTYDLEFITPAFLAGANQGRAELRAASVRGALRWWFRALGGTKDEEAEVFGGVQGGAKRSKVAVRCCVAKPVHAQFPTPPSMSDLGYLYYFATVSGETKGIRIRPEAYFAPETRFSIQIEDGGIPVNLDGKFWNAVECFIRLGTLGLRATRGCGAFAEKSLLEEAEFVEWAKSFPSSCGVVRLVSDEVFSSAKEAQKCLGGWLKAFRGDHHLSGRDRTALGYSDRRERMSSALKLRPAKVKEGFLAAIFYSDAACSCASVKGLVEGL